MKQKQNKQSVVNIRKNFFHGHRIVAALDTCVLIDATSPVDLYHEYEKLQGQVITGSSDTAKGPMRRARAKDGILLLEHFHERKLGTYFLGEEMQDVLRKLVPPEGAEFTTGFAVVFAHFVVEPMFPGWVSASDHADAGLSGNDRDRLLVRRAKELGVPVISNETKPDGAIAQAADKAGVRVVTPRQFWEAKDTEAHLIEEFLGRWLAKRHEIYRRARPSFRSDAIAENVVGYMDGYFRHVLLGERRAA